MRNLLARHIFRHYWEAFCIAAALGEWGLACWALGISVGPVAHLGAIAGLFALNRLAAVAYEREDDRAPILHRSGGVVLAAGLVASGGTGGLVVGAVLWMLVVRAGGLSAEAGMLTLVPSVTADPIHAVFAMLGLAGGMGLVADGYLRGYRRLTVSRLEVTLPHLPSALDGLRVVHVSDLHLGPLAHRATVRDGLELANAEAPDLVVVTGDIVDSPHTDLDSWLPELDRLTARLGVFAILGNHDGRLGHAEVAAGIHAHTRWRVLRDETALVDIGGERLAIVGLEDRPVPWESARLPALAATLPPAVPAILLAHHPKVFHAARAAGLPLTLAGHTHGGQLAVPGLPRLNAARVLMTPLDAGTFVEDGCVLHVSRGLGTSGQRLRIGVPREITVITLRTPADG
ncbi:MAG TPA: metallophosphoesterase [Candidatus Eisenbacteria bacterium]|nr:metallophosphoesterase [Candidatus Eisenbacteria bacterium]